MVKLSIMWAFFQLVVMSGNLVAQTDVASANTTLPTKENDQTTINPGTTVSPQPTPTLEPTSQSTKAPNSENVTNSTIAPENPTTSSDISTESTTTEVKTTQIPTPDELDATQMDNEMFCSCDLTAGQCDINCCCDPDCSSEDRRLFDSCWKPPVSEFERYYCSTDSDRYGLAWNNTAEYRTEWNPHSGLFCIVTDNVPKRRMFEDKPPTTEEELFKDILPKFANRWNDRHVARSGIDQWIYQPFYKEGSPIFSLHINGTISILKLPRSLNSASCNTARPVHFLNQENTECYLPGEQCNPTLRPDEWLANLAVFRLPSYAAYSNGNSNSSTRWGDMDRLAPIILRICEKQFECRSDLRPPEPSCQQFLSSVTLRIGYNGTEGIRSVLVDLLYTNQSTGGGLVRFETIYQSLADRPSASNPVRLRSGNPGYLQSKPLVAAKLNSSSGQGAFRSLQLFGNTPKSRMIRFGEDTYQIVRTDRVKMDNRTEWCAKWRHFVLQSFWGSDFDDLRLAAYGNTELNDTSTGSWLPIEVQTELECYGSVIHGDLVVIYVKSGTYDQPEYKLIGAGLRVRSDEGLYCSESVDCSLLLSQTVSFIMSDSPTYMILPEPPRWKIELPNDFFYPFLLSAGNRPDFVHVCSLLFVVLQLLSRLI